MKHKENEWGWMLAVDFFFAGMGGGMLVIAGIIELFIGGGRTSFLGNLLGPAFMGIGCSFLILELGRPMQAWRVFMNPKAILTCGAWIMSIAMVTGIIYAAFGLNPSWIGADSLAFQEMTGLRKLLAVVNVLTGLVVATYPGVLLGRHKGRPFWVGPGIITLFMLSSIVTGVAAHFVSGLVLAPAADMDVLEKMPALAGALLFFQAVSWFGYIWVKRTGATAAEAASALRWINGDLSTRFIMGFLVVGTVLPMFMSTMTSSMKIQGVAALLVLLGGLIMRLLVVKAGEDRTMIPGEKKYRSRLPLGEEPFLKAWNK